MIRKLSVAIPDEVISQAHEVYKERGGKYAYMKRGWPKMVEDNDLWRDILFELMPEAFWS